MCGVQYHHEPVIDDRVRLDPLDPKTARHAGQCEFDGVTDPAVLRAVLRVTRKDGYWLGRVQCLRHRLAGSALRRERRVTTNPLPDTFSAGLGRVVFYAGRSCSTASALTIGRLTGATARALTTR